MFFLRSIYILTNFISFIILQLSVRSRIPFKLFPGFRACSPPVFPLWMLNLLMNLNLEPACLPRQSMAGLLYRGYDKIKYFNEIISWPSFQIFPPLSRHFWILHPEKVYIDIAKNIDPSRAKKLPLSHGLSNICSPFKEGS